MSFHISKAAGGFQLPKIDPGSMDNSILREAKNLLGQVAHDSFTLSSQPGEVFADHMNLNILGENVRLPNPVGMLANTLLGDVDGRLGQYGVNVDFKKLLGEAFQLPTEQGAVSVPSLKDRLQGGGAPADLQSLGAPAQDAPQVGQSFDTGVGGAGRHHRSHHAHGAHHARHHQAAASGADASGQVAPPADQTTASADTGTSPADATSSAGAASVSASAATSTPVPSGSGTVSSTGDATQGALGVVANADSQVNNLLGSINANTSQADLIKIQTQLSQYQEMIQLISSILKQEHDTRMSMIQNIR